MKWFRMYHDARQDGKLNSLTDAQFRVWFRLMCLASEHHPRGTVQKKSERLMAIETSDGNIELYRESIAILTELEILDVSDSTITFIHWNKRQFASDSSTVRVQRHREQSSNGDETLQKRSGNVALSVKEQSNRITESEEKKKDHDQPACADCSSESSIIDGAQSDTTGSGRDASAEKSKSEYTEEFERFWSAYPRHKAKSAAYRVWKARLKEHVLPGSLIDAAKAYAQECERQRTEMQYRKLAQTFLGPDKHFAEYIRGPDGLSESTEIIIEETRINAPDTELEQIRRNAERLMAGWDKPNIP